MRESDTGVGAACAAGSTTTPRVCVCIHRAGRDPACADVHCACTCKGHRCAHTAPPNLAALCTCVHVRVYTHKCIAAGGHGHRCGRAWPEWCVPGRSVGPSGMQGARTDCVSGKASVHVRAGCVCTPRQVRAGWVPVYTGAQGCAPGMFVHGRSLLVLRRCSCTGDGCALGMVVHRRCSCTGNGCVPGMVAHRRCSCTGDGCAPGMFVHRGCLCTRQRACLSRRCVCVCAVPAGG